MSIAMGTFVKLDLQYLRGMSNNIVLIYISRNFIKCH